MPRKDRKKVTAEGSHFFICAYYIPAIFLTVFAVRIVIIPLTPEAAVFDHQFVF